MAKLEGAFEGTLTPDQQREILELAERLKESRVNHLSVAELEAAAAETVNDIQKQLVKRKAEMKSF